MALAPSQHVLTRFFFLRALAVVTAMAIHSLWGQLPGLIGIDGITPYPAFLERVAAATEGSWRWLELAPTLAWWAETNSILDGLCLGGLGLCGLLFLGIWEGPVILGLFTIVLSLSVVGQQWLGFQWDALLVETLFTSLFIANWRPWPRYPVEPSPIGILLLWVLLWKLVFFAGLVKLTGGDPSWRDLTATTYHYETQPLANPVSWYAHHLPLAWHKAEVVGMFLVELVLVWAIFLGPALRKLAFVAICGLMGGLFLTGNYGYFQLLTLTLALSLIGDSTWLKWVPSRLLPLLLGGPPPSPLPVSKGWSSPQMTEAWLRRSIDAPSIEETPTAYTPPWRRYLQIPAVTGLIVVNLGVLHGQLADAKLLPGLEALGEQVGMAPVTTILARTRDGFRHWRIVNTYGLFQTMTKTQPELRFEGSADGAVWLEYPFRYKPDRPEKRPPFALWHMPRLDWQLWFAALRAGSGTSGCQRSPWVAQVGARLLEGSDDVEALFASSPFPEEPPKQLKITVRSYEFTEPDDPSGAWWTAGPERLFCPILRR